MKKILVTSALAALALMPASAQKVNKSSSGYPITPVPFTSVKVWNNTFWGQRIVPNLSQSNHPAGFQQVRIRGKIQEL